MKSYEEYMAEGKIRNRKNFIENTQENIVEQLYSNINIIIERYETNNNL